MVKNVHRVNPSVLREFNQLVAEIQDQLIVADPKNADQILKNLRSVAEGRYISSEEKITLSPRAQDFNSLYFVSPTHQFVNVLEWNERFNWKIPESVFSAFCDEPPEWPKNELSAVVLTVYLETEKETYRSLWEVIARNMRERNVQSFRSDTGLPALLPGVEHPGVCLRWEVIDFSPLHIGAKPADIRNPEFSPHSAILSAAAHFPDWIIAMNGKDVPYVWLHGYAVKLGISEPWPNRVPLLAWDKDHVELSLELYAENRDVAEATFPWYIA